MTTFASLETDWANTLASRMPHVERQGRVLILQGDVLPGRFLYDLAHLAIEQHGVLEIEEGSKEHKILQAIEALLRSLREKEAEVQARNKMWF